MPLYCFINWLVQISVVSAHKVMHFDTHVVGVDHGSLVYRFYFIFSFLYCTKDYHFYSIVSTNTVIVMDLIVYSVV